MNKLLTIIAEAGIVGLGGAGFPTHLKFQNAKNIDTIILNGAECEPYITSDYRVMIEDTEKVIDGLKIMMKIAMRKMESLRLKKVRKKPLML